MPRSPQERTFLSDGTVVSARDAMQVRNGLVITKEQVDEPETLARILTRLITDVRSAVGGRKSRIDFEDVTCTSGTDVRLEHRFGGRVRWWLADWTGAAPADFSKSSSTTADVLILTCAQSGTATIRVEAT